MARAWISMQLRGEGTVLTMDPSMVEVWCAGVHLRKSVSCSLHLMQMGTKLKWSVVLIKCLKLQTLVGFVLVKQDCTKNLNFFVVQAYRKPVPDGLINIFTPLSTFLWTAQLINLSNIDNFFYQQNGNLGQLDLEECLMTIVLRMIKGLADEICMN